ncbi:hypothetical protein PHMEG_00040860, partial [Phytophthora megakarya]
IHFSEVVGAVTRTVWLSGAAVNFGVAAMCGGRTDCLVLSSHNLGEYCPKSCGIMILDMVHTYVGMPTRGFQLDDVSADYVKLMRLRYIWLLTCGSRFQADAESNEAVFQSTDKELISVFKPSI